MISYAKSNAERSYLIVVFSKSEELIMNNGLDLESKLEKTLTLLLYNL